MTLQIIRRVIRQSKSGAISLCVVKETAEFYGWDKAFEEWHPPGQVDPVTGRRRPMPRRYARNHPGGKRLRICRDALKRGYPGGKTNCFRLTGKFSNDDLKTLAQVAGEKFEWMEAKNLARLSRAEWLA